MRRAGRTGGAVEVGAVMTGPTLVSAADSPPRCTRVQRVPDADEPCVVRSWPIGEDGRKLFAGTALFSEDCELLAVARQTWIAPRLS